MTCTRHNEVMTFTLALASGDCDLFFHDDQSMVYVFFTYRTADVSPDSVSPPLNGGLEVSRGD